MSAPICRHRSPDNSQYISQKVCIMVRVSKAVQGQLRAWSVCPVSLEPGRGRAKNPGDVEGGGEGIGRRQRAEDRGLEG